MLNLVPSTLAIDARESTLGVAGKAAAMVDRASRETIFMMADVLQQCELQDVEVGLYTTIYPMYYFNGQVASLRPEARSKKAR